MFQYLTKEHVVKAKKSLSSKILKMDFSNKKWKENFTVKEWQTIVDFDKSIDESVKNGWKVLIMKVEIIMGKNKQHKRPRSR